MLYSSKITGPLAFGLQCLLSFSQLSAAASIPRDVSGPRAAVAIKLTSSALRVRATGAELVENLVQKAQESAGLVRRDEGFKVLPLYDEAVLDQLAELIQQAKEVTPDYEPADFGAWYQVVFESEHKEHDDESYKLISNLLENSEVASCQTLGGGSSPAIFPTDDPKYVDQNYLQGSGVGIDAKYAWGFPGGDGAKTRVVDLERGWKLDHEDFPKIELLAGKNVLDRYGGNYPHGTSVLGEILMQDNKIGGVGIAPYARGDVIGIARDVNGAYNENPPQAIMDGVSRLSKGDVMILEMQVSNETGFYYPQEVNDAEFEAIKLATAKGIIVVEPAGNGNENDAGSNLDQPLVRWGETTPRGFFIQGHPDYRDSGAIIVGAGTAAYPRSKMPWSNYGKRVDVHSWGEKIMTSTVDGSVQDTYANFGGTSGAAPIIAGAALSAQGIRVANGRAKLGALEMRSLLKTGGTPTVSSVDRIGVQPNLRALIDGGHLK